MNAFMPAHCRNCQEQGEPCSPQHSADPERLDIAAHWPTAGDPSPWDRPADLTVSSATADPF